MSFCLTFWLMTPVAAFLSLWSDKLCCKSLQCQELAPHGASDEIWTQLSKQTNSFIWHHYNNILTSLNTLLSLSHSSIKHLHLASILSLALKASPTVQLFLFSYQCCFQFQVTISATFYQRTMWGLDTKIPTQQPSSELSTQDVWLW